MDERFLVFVCFSFFSSLDVVAASRISELVEAEVCNMEHFEASCGRDQVIIIEHAQYGRYKKGVCVTGDFGLIGCVLDVMLETEMACSGRRSCKMHVNDVTFKIANPCHKEFKNHLWVGYRCLPVFTPNKKCSKGETTTIDLTSKALFMQQQPRGEGQERHPSHQSSNNQHGSHNFMGSSSSALHHYLSSAVTEATGCGSSFSPWLLEAGEGQKINLTLYDYSYDSLSNYYKALQPNNSSSHRIPSMTCRILATVTENNSRNGALRICAGQGKVHSVFNSVSNQVQVRLLLPSTALQSSDSPQPNPLGFQFLFKIQVMGCANPAVQPGMRVRRMAHHVVIDCSSDVGPKWELTCINDMWVGNYSNCSQGMLSFSSKLGLMFPYATSVVVVTIIASFMVCFILTAGILCIKWRLKQDMVHTHYQTKAFGSNDLVYDFSAVNQHSLPLGEERKYRALPIDRTANFSGGCLENLNEYATMRLLQQEAEEGFRGAHPGSPFTTASQPANQQLSTVVVMGPNASVANARQPYPSNVSTFFSSDPNEAYRSDHIYESPDLVKEEVDKLNMTNKPPVLAPSQQFANKNLAYSAKNFPNVATSPKISQAKLFNQKNSLQTPPDKLNQAKFQEASSFNALRCNDTEGAANKSNLNRDFMKI